MLVIFYFFFHFEILNTDINFFDKIVGLEKIIISWSNIQILIFIHLQLVSQIRKTKKQNDFFVYFLKLFTIKFTIKILSMKRHMWNWSTMHNELSPRVNFIIIKTFRIIIYPTNNINVIGFFSSYLERSNVAMDKLDKNYGNLDLQCQR